MSLLKRRRCPVGISVDGSFEPSRRSGENGRRDEEWNAEADEFNLHLALDLARVLDVSGTYEKTR
jgi:hypothetical protein